MKKEIICVGIQVLITSLAFFLWAGLALAQSSTHYSIRFDVISGGGGEAGSTGYSSFGTLGQSSPIGTSTSTGYANHAGFWYLLEPDVSISPSAWNFERVFIGQSTTRTFTVTNPGTGDLAIGDLNLTGSSEFDLLPLDDHCSNQVLGPPPETCTFVVVFSPTSLGAKAATVSVPSNDEESPLTVGLSGRGVRLMVNPEEGTIGTLVSIGGSGFGTKKGKALVGTAGLKIQIWGSSSIPGTLTKALPPMAYDVVVVRKEPKGASSITEPGGFTVKVPEIGTVTPPSGAPLVEITITGKFFGTKKGKVYLEKGGVSKACKIISWTMTPDTGVSTIHFLVPKGFASDTYTLRVTNKVGSGTGSFTVTP